MARSHLGGAAEAERAIRDAVHSTGNSLHEKYSQIEKRTTDSLDLVSRILHLLFRIEERIEVRESVGR